MLDTKLNTISWCVILSRHPKTSMSNQTTFMTLYTVSELFVPTTSHITISNRSRCSFLRLNLLRHMELFISLLPGVLSSIPSTPFQKKRIHLFLQFVYNTTLWLNLFFPSTHTLFFLQSTSTTSWHSRACYRVSLATQVSRQGLRLLFYECYLYSGSLRSK